MQFSDPVSSATRLLPLAKSSATFAFIVVCWSSTPGRGSAGTEFFGPSRTDAYSQHRRGHAPMVALEPRLQ